MDAVDLKTRKESFVNLTELRRAMDQANLDAVVAISAKNSFYLTGCYLESQVFSRERLGLLVATRKGPETFIVCNLEEPMVRYVGTWVEDVRMYVEFAESPIESLAKVLSEKGLAGARIGIEEKYFTIHYYDQMKHLLPKATFVAADSLFATVRALKTPAEIELLQKAARLTEEATYHAWKRSHPGDTEEQVANRMAEELVKRGAAAHHLMFGSGENTLVIHHNPGAKKLQVGDLTACDFGAVYKGFWSDLGRMGAVGEASDRQRRLYGILRDVHLATIDRMRPGVTGGEVFNFAKKMYMDRGVDFAWRPHIGHSMAQIRGHDEPMIQPFDRNPLAPTMTIALEPSFRDGRERYHIEDLVLITEGQPRILSDWWDTQEMFLFE